MRGLFFGLVLILVAVPAGAQQPSGSGSIATTNQVSDQAIETRIRGILETMDSLDSVTVDVESGVVVLRGQVASEDDRKQAADLSSRVEGAVAVENDIRVTRNVSARGQAVYDRLLLRLENFITSVPLFLIALAVFLLFLWASRVFVRHPVMISRISANPFLRQLLVQSVRVSIIVLGLLIALEILDATALIGAVLGAAGVTGIVLGFALKETIENYVAGLLLSLRQPFAPNDHLLILGHEGRVIRLTSRATVLMSFDGNHVRIPNAEVFKSTLVNFTRNPERRFEFDIGVGVQTDLIEARDLAVETLSDMDAVLASPPPEARVETLGDSNVVLRIFGWVDQRSHDLFKVRGEAIRRVKIVFEAAEYDLPEPIYRLNLMNTGVGQLTQAVDGAVEGGGEGGFRTAGQDAPGDRPVPDEQALDKDVDLSRDTHLDREVAQERAELADKDMLQPGAEQE